MFACPVVSNWDTSDRPGVGALVPKSESVAGVCAQAATLIKTNASTVRIPSGIFRAFITLHVTRQTFALSPPQSDRNAHNEYALFNMHDAMSDGASWK